MIHLRALPSAHKSALRHIRVETHARLRTELRVIEVTPQPDLTGLGGAEIYSDKRARKRQASAEFRQRSEFADLNFNHTNEGTFHDRGRKDQNAR